MIAPSLPPHAIDSSQEGDITVSIPIKLINLTMQNWRSLNVNVEDIAEVESD